MYEIQTVNGKQYKVVNNTFYHIETADKVLEVLESVRRDRTRILVDYGDTKTGVSWGDVNDIRGYVGRSTGSVKIPLLVYNSRSYGGGALSTNCLIKISESRGGRVLYQLNN